MLRWILCCGQGCLAAGSHEIKFTGGILGHAAVPVGFEVKRPLTGIQIPIIHRVLRASEGVPLTVEPAFPAAAQMGGARVFASLQPVLDKGIRAALEKSLLGGDIHGDQMRPLPGLARATPEPVISVIAHHPATRDKRVPSVHLPPERKVPRLEPSALAAKFLGQRPWPAMHGADRRGVTFVIPDGENVIVRLRMRLNARIPRRAAAPAERFVIGVHRLARLRHAHFVDQNIAGKVVIKHQMR